MCEGPGTLWIVATPIGSLGDVSPRAREVLAAVEVIVAEDTRRSRRLLSHLEVPSRGRLQSLHEHNEKQKVPKLIDRLRDGVSIALVSDAGTPVLSDPGFLLVRAAREHALPVCSVPGSSSFTAALAASGQSPLPATLCGFLPPRAGARKRRIAELDVAPWTMVILLSPHRLGAELADLAEVLGGDRPATLLAELSKKHERATMATLTEIAQQFETEKPRGEYVLVVAPKIDQPAREVDSESVKLAYQQALDKGLDRPTAMREVATRFRIRRRQVFDFLATDSQVDAE